MDTVDTNNKNKHLGGYKGGYKSKGGYMTHAHVEYESWSQRHRQSERYAYLAEAAISRGDDRLAAGWYRLAAEAEELALASLGPSQPLTLGITAVSAASLWLKAGEAQEARRVAMECLALPGLPEFAGRQLREIAEETTP